MVLRGDGAVYIHREHGGSHKPVRSIPTMSPLTDNIFWHFVENPTKLYYTLAIDSQAQTILFNLYLYLFDIFVVDFCEFFSKMSKMCLVIKLLILEYILTFIPRWIASSSYSDSKASRRIMKNTIFPYFITTLHIYIQLSKWRVCFFLLFSIEEHFRRVLKLFGFIC